MAQINGFESALEALRALDSTAQKRILSEILRQDPEMAHRLKSHLIRFEDLLKINAQGMVRLFEEVPDAKWVLALRGQAADFVDRLLKPLAQRRSDLFKAALAQLGPQPVLKIEAAQKDILVKALELESKGLLEIFVSK